MTKVMFNFKYYKDIIKLEIKNCWYEFVKHILYFVESAPVLNDLIFFV